MNPYIFTYNSIAVSWFLVLLVASFSYYYFFSKELAIAKLTQNSRENIAIASLIMTLLGARIFYIARNFDFFLNNWRILYQPTYLTLDIRGAFLALVLVSYIYTKKYNLKSKILLNKLLQGAFVVFALLVWTRFFYNLLAYQQVLFLSIISLILYFLAGVINQRQEDNIIVIIVSIIFYFLII